MKRRSFFNKLLGVGVTLAVAPRVIAEIVKDPETYTRLEPKTEFSVDDLDEAIRAVTKDNYIFSGQRIAWNAKGEIICDMEQGCSPRINDMVLIQLLWNNNTVNVAAMVTAIIGMNGQTDFSIRLLTLDKDAPDLMDKIIDDGFSKSYPCTNKHAAYYNEDHRTIFAQFAYRGIIMANAYPEYRGQPGVFSYVDPRQHPMKPGECYREGHMNIDWDNLEK